MKLSRIQQIIKEEVAKAVSEIDINRDIEKNLEKVVGFEPPAPGGPENKMRTKPPGYDGLPDTGTEGKPIYLPSVQADDSTITLYSKKAVDKWIEDFKSKYNEQPEFTITQYGLDVTNDKFQADKKTYMDRKSGGLEKFKSID